MSSPVVTYLNGYQELPYLQDAYMQGDVQYAYGFQATMQIVDHETPKGFQGQMVIEASKVEGFQSQMVIDQSKTVGFQAAMNAVDYPYAVGLQGQMVIEASKTDGFQAMMDVSTEKVVGLQGKMVVYTETPKGFQAEMVIDDGTGQPSFQALMDVATEKANGLQGKMVVISSKVTGFQALMQISDHLARTGFSAKHDTLRHVHREYYLEDPYLSDVYMGEAMLAYPGFQAKMVTHLEDALGFQSLMTIDSHKKTGFQGQMIVDTSTPRGFQANFIEAGKFGFQSTMVIYNNTQFRLMDTFPSRGTAALLGDNWTASNQASGDFLPKNLNTDIEEQVFRSASTTVELVCDTGVSQGVTLDTIAIRNHNLTTDALVQVQGSNDPSFSSINVSFDMTVELKNMYYVAAVFPAGVANQNRYWRFIFQDPTNADGYVQIGILLFGTSRLFSTLENFENPLQIGYKHFKDAVPTEGFTNVMNDRALKKNLRLSFRNLERSNGNFRMMQTFFEFCRTSLKALVIPTPMYPSRYAVFAKMADIPRPEARNVAAMDDPDGTAEYLDFDIEWDESF